MKIYFNNTTRVVKTDKNNEKYINYNNFKYILTYTTNDTTILKNDCWGFDKILAVILK